jgi:hypothetical protein
MKASEELEIAREHLREMQSNLAHWRKFRFHYRNSVITDRETRLAKRAERSVLAAYSWVHDAQERAWIEWQQEYWALIYKRAMRLKSKNKPLSERLYRWLVRQEAAR